MKRRLLIPEVIQTSAMDCGPAALKALFGGYGVYLSYGRLREACQTDVDGTSIDTIENIAVRLGMSATQMMLPPDCLLLESSGCWPAIVVVSLPDGAAHMVVVWRVHGPWIQIMDPAAGRLWLPRRRFLESLYRHEHEVPLSDWQAWSASHAFRATLHERMRVLDVPVAEWSDPTLQDAALRLAGTLAARGHLRRGAESRRFLTMCATRPAAIPAQYFAARPSPDAQTMQLQGAVLLRAAVPATRDAVDDAASSLRRVRTEAAPRVWQAAASMLRQGGWSLPTLVILALTLAAVGSVLEALLFRGLFDLARHLPSTALRLAAMLALLAFLAALLAFEWPAWCGVSRLGRHLELGLRAALLRKIPLLDDRYFQSRLISDMALRAHSLQLLRQLPDMASQGLQLAVNLLVTGLAIACLYPGSAWLAALAVLSACLIPSAFLAPMSERDLRSREISGALSAVYLDALQGARAIQAHGAQRNMLSVQAALLKRWADAGLRQQSMALLVDGLQMLLTYGCVIALVMRSVATGQGPAGLLLLVYWAVSIPALGRNLGLVFRAIPGMRNTLLRFLEPIAAPEQTLPAPTVLQRAGGGVRINFARAGVVAAGRSVLEEITLDVLPGEHIGIVGVSGAGKSSLLGCLLGWHELHSGSLRVDDVELDAAGIAQLRRVTAWIDPQVHLFGGSLYANLQFGNEDGAALSIEEAIAGNDLEGVVSRMAGGLQAALGDGGNLVSGGEGQRIRAARAFRREHVRLALIDEPARGLGREQRRLWLAGARRRFADATVLCVSHDVSDTLGFDRIVVIEQGRIVEQGAPHALRASPGSRYAQLLVGEAALTELWANPAWRKLRLQAGVMTELASRACPPA